MVGGRYDIFWKSAESPDKNMCEEDAETSDGIRKPMHM